MRILFTIVALVALPWTAGAAVTPKVPLLATIAVVTDEVRLSDFLPPGAPGSLRAQAAQVMLGQTPRPGTVRVMDIVELEHQLRPSLLCRLSFPPQMTVTRTSYPLAPEQVAAALREAMAQRGIKATLGEVEITAAPLLTGGAPKLRVLDIRYDAMRQRWTARMAIENQPGTPAFLVTAAGAGPLRNDRAANVAMVRPQPLLKSGQHATLVLSEGAFHATIPVVCLDSGAAGQEIRVRDLTNGKIHHALIGEGGAVQTLGDPK